MTTTFDRFAQLLRQNGVGPWMVDALGRTVTVDQFAEQALDDAVADYIPDAVDDADKARQLRAMLDEKPNQKYWSASKIREVLDA